MNAFRARAWAAALLAGLAAAPAAARDLQRFAVNEYFGIAYDREPVSFDVTLGEPVPAASIGLRPGPCQVEIVEGTPERVRKARVWTMASFQPNSYRPLASDVRDWPGLVAKINAELKSDQPTVGKLAWGHLRRQLRLPREAKGLRPGEPTEAEKESILRALGDFAGRLERDTPALLAALGLDAKHPADVARLKDRRVPPDVVQRLNRAAMEAAWGRLIAPCRFCPRQVIYTVHTDGRRQDRPQPPGGPSVADAGRIAGVPIAVVSNGLVHVKVPVGGVTFDPPASPFDVPGPVVGISRDGKEWIGSGYLDPGAPARRVKSIACETRRGCVYFESDLHYAFENGRSYKVRVRVYASKPYARLVEDFDVGGAARFVFSFDDWFADAFFRTGDNKLYGWQSITADNPCGDFVRIEGQRALARLVIWSQFNYFGGKQETIALKAPDPAALEGAHEAAVAKYKDDLARYRRQVAEYKAQWDRYEQDQRRHAEDLARYRELLAAHRKDPEKVKKPREPRPPREPRTRTFRSPLPPEKPEYRQTVHALAGAPIRATSAITPGGDATAVGGFYVRPDRWTRAKVNHVDLYMRPEVPGDRMTRGIVGLQGARQRIAMEAWLVDGHREWAIFAVRAGDERWLAKAHVQEGVWPLDRIRRLPLVWSSDRDKPVKLADTAPPETGAAGDACGRVLLDTRGRSGLQTFNGSEGRIRGTRPRPEGWDGTVTPTSPAAGSAENLRMVEQAMTAYLAADESAYPSFRAMLPWTDPEAINPFYQGMENMNFNADLYRYVTTYGLRLARRGHPEAMRFLEHGAKSFDMALDRYVYPQSGCWEESHGYAGHTLRTVAPLVMALKNSGRRNFLEDIRFARMLEFFIHAHTPVDAEWGSRAVPAVGDHGQSRVGPAGRLGENLGLFVGSKDPEIRRIVRQAAWLIREDGGKVPGSVKPEKPDLRSRWLQGYGAVLRALDPTGEKTVVLTLKGALIRQERDKPPARHDLHLSLRQRADGKFAEAVAGRAPTYNKGTIAGRAKVKYYGGGAELSVELTVGDDRWVKGGKGRYAVGLSCHGDGSFKGTYDAQAVQGPVTIEAMDRPRESFLVLRAGQSWGHHHEDKGSMWFWGRNVHFFGDCGWGAPPGGTYWNLYKQGPASGTQIEFVGVLNWTLPCKFPAPWICDAEYADGFDYADARCLYPYNPKLDLAESSPAATRNGYDRQVLFVHPDLLIVRDNVETVCPTIWRMHSFQPTGTKADGSRATLASAQGVIGELAILYPAEGVKLRAVDRDILNRKYSDADGKPLPYEKLPRFGSSVELRWDMPPNTSATWVFGVHGKDEAAPKAELLDGAGKVTRVRLADGREVTALMNVEPFRYSGDGFEFDGTVGLVIRAKDGRVTAHPIRSKIRTGR